MQKKSGYVTHSEKISLHWSGYVWWEAAGGGGNWKMEKNNVCRTMQHVTKESNGNQQRKGMGEESGVWLRRRRRRRKKKRKKERVKVKMRREALALSREREGEGGINRSWLLVQEQGGWWVGGWGKKRERKKKNVYLLLFFCIFCSVCIWVGCSSFFLLNFFGCLSLLFWHY